MPHVPLIWVIGASGQVGSALKYVIDASFYPWQVQFFSRAAFDITYKDSMQAHFSQSTPSCIVNLAAYTAVDKAESEVDKAYAVNATGVGILAQLCAENAVPLIHVSTDYVFSGTADKPYSEDAAIAPQSVYGLSKAAGEALVRTHHAAHVILRTSWVVSDTAENFISKILLKGRKLDTLSVVSDQIGAPTAAIHLAKVLCQIIERMVERIAIYGTYHYRDAKVESWFTFAKTVVELAATIDAHYETVTVLPVPTSAYKTPAVRPLYSVLGVQKLIEDYKIVPYSLVDVLSDMVRLTLERMTHVST